MPHTRPLLATSGSASASAGAVDRRPAVRSLLDRDVIAAVVLTVLLAAAPPILAAIGAPFWADVLNRIMILGLAAVSLNLLIGVAGLVSFGHSVYLGLGGYAVGIAAFHGVDDGFIQLGLAIATSAAFALLTGLVVLRTRGAHFIMITMAFAQMVYFVMIGLKQYGGDDGLTINSRSVFPAPFDIEDRTTLYYLTLGVLALAMIVFARLRTSRFGLVLTAAKGNERRVAAVGFDPYRYRLAAYVIGGVGCGLAGFLSANFTNFVTPEVMSWTRSGELMFMIILGGVGTVSGPLIGAAIFLLVEQLLGSLTVYWHFWFGLFLIGIVLYARGGLVGILLGRRSR
jgi:branched-chain amino acid transport system permease protein